MTDHPEPDSSGTDHSGTDHSGTDHSGTDHSGTDHSDSAEVAAERKQAKKAKRKAAEQVRIDEAVAEAERRWRDEHRTEGESVTAYLNPRRHPVVAALAAVFLAALIATAVLGVLLARSSSELSALRTLNADKETAESIAGAYAVGAATFTHTDLGPWSAALKKGTADELNSRFDVAVETLTPLIQEVQWVQTAELIAATTIDVRADRLFVVQVFVATQMTSTQNPGGLNTVTPYTITLDRDANWIITDVAGIGGVAQDGSAPSAGGGPASVTTSATTRPTP